MNVKCISVLIALVCVITAGGVQTAIGAQFDSTVNPNEEKSEFRILYQKALLIDYESGGDIAKHMRGVSVDERFTTTYPNSELDWIVDRLNENILKDQSSARVTELDLMHSVVINGRADRATIDYSVLLEGTISNYRIGDKDSDGRQLIDLGWRGLSVYEPTVVDGIEINLPISAIENHVPSVYEMIRGTDAEVLLSKPIMDGSAILEQGLTSWHFLFDSTGTNIDAERYGLDESIEGVIYSRYTMGESSIREGIKTEIEETATIDLDTRYSFTTIQSSDNANLHIVGYAAIDTLDDLEIAGVTTTKIDSDTSTGDFPALIVYGMAGMAVVGGIVFFIISGRQLKREEGQGQSGIDPSRLTGYQTSASAGGYQTNRGEAQLTEAGGYDQHQNVYDDTNSENPPATQVTHSDATCGCSASAEMGSECDCAMQSSCLCDGTCDCNAEICKENTSAMR